MCWRMGPWVGCVVRHARCGTEDVPKGLLDVFEGMLDVLVGVLDVLEGVLEPQEPLGGPIRHAHFLPVTASY